MQIIDRYVTFLFVKIFLICFFSVAGLYVVIDSFANLEELLTMGKTGGGVAPVLIDYYGPRIFQFFDRTAPFLALTAAVFALVLMQRSNETIAIQAAGISQARLARPILWATVVLVLIAVVNREWWIPQVRTRLTVNAQDLASAREHSIGFIIDHATGIIIRGKHVKPTEQTIWNPEFVLPDKLNGYGDVLVAESGKYLARKSRRPAGFLLQKVVVDEAARGAPSQFLDDWPVILRPSDTSWLEPDQVFVVTDIDAQRLAFGPQLLRYASLSEMIAQSRKPSSSFSNRQRVDLHARIVQPIFDLTILLVGLPMVISRRERNLFLSVGMCLLLVATMILSVIAFHALGASRIVNPPALAAWLPLLVFVPIAAVTYRFLDR